jgi:drug/metabolite transporter (DMT)-like permease
MMIALLVALVVIPGTVGDVLNSMGMKRQGEITDWSLRGLLRVARSAAGNFYILIGIPAMAVSFFALMSLLSTTAMSFAVPITASSYILETAIAKYWLRERVDWRRWAGTVLVAIGIALLSI